MNLYVGNLAYGTSEDDLRDTFSSFGTVTSVNLIKDRFSGESKGFAFVEMENNAAADAAIKGLNGSKLGGRSIKVNQSKPKSKRSSRPPRR